VFVPGWDCHGLPIELKALRSQPAGSLSGCPTEVRSIAEGCALEAIEGQRADMIRWGAMADWEVSAADGAPNTARSYRTLDPSYEAEQLRLFSHLARTGCLKRGEQPVYWSPATKTALAEAELEYSDDHVSRSIYVAFPISKQPPGTFDQLSSQARSLVTSYPELLATVWTTTPWTLPGNVALAVGPEIEYVVAREATAGGLSSGNASMSEGGRRHFLVAKDRLGDLGRVLEQSHAGDGKGVAASMSSEGNGDPASNPWSSLEIVDVIRGSDLRGLWFDHPLKG